MVIFYMLRYWGVRISLDMSQIPTWDGFVSWYIRPIKDSNPMNPVLRMHWIWEIKQFISSERNWSDKNKSFQDLPNAVRFRIGIDWSWSDRILLFRVYSILGMGRFSNDPTWCLSQTPGFHRRLQEILRKTRSSEDKSWRWTPWHKGPCILI